MSRQALPHEPVSYAHYWPIAGMWSPNEHPFSKGGWSELFSTTKNKVRFTLANGQQVIVEGRLTEGTALTDRLNEGDLIVVDVAQPRTFWDKLFRRPVKKGPQVRRVTSVSPPVDHTADRYYPDFD